MAPSLPTPAQPLSLSGSVPPGSIPPYPSSGPTGPSWHTPNTSYASITVSAPRARSNALLAASAVALAVVALGAGVGLGWKGRGPSNSAALAKTATTTTQAAPPPATSPLPATGGATTAAAAAAAAASVPPSISVDALPGTNAGKALGPVPRGAGRLLVTATPGWCNLSVDGKERGPTPVAGIDLPAGAHQLRCDAPGGKVKTTNVTIQEGATSRIKIALDE